MRSETTIVQGKCEEVTVSWGSFLWGLFAIDQQDVFLSTLAIVRNLFFLVTQLFLFLSGLIGPCNSHHV